MTMTVPPPHAISFSRRLGDALESRFPRRFANAGDACGMTIGTLREVERGGTTVVMLCVDLTEQVLAEAVAFHADHVVTYSPMPPHPMQTIRVDDPTGRIILKCAQHSIAVHSIHTACANAPGGASHWLASSLSSGSLQPIRPHDECADAGEGRLLECERAVPLSAIIARLKELLSVRHLRLALGAVVDEQNLAKAQECCFVKTIALQVGEGAGVLRGCDANVYITSEMSHTDVLAANAQGVVVLLVGQSSMERAYLRHLEGELHNEFVDADWNVKVKCAQADCSPLTVV